MKLPENVIKIGAQYVTEDIEAVVRDCAEVCRKVDAGLEDYQNCGHDAAIAILRRYGLEPKGNLKHGWNRALSPEDLVIVTSWFTLAEKEPELGQECVYKIITDSWSGNVETGTWGKLEIPTGFSYTRNATFINEKGWLASDPNETYWKIFEEDFK